MLTVTVGPPEMIGYNLAPEAQNILNTLSLNGPDLRARFLVLRADGLLVLSADERFTAPSLDTLRNLGVPFLQGGALQHLVNGEGDA